MSGPQRPEQTPQNPHYEVRVAARVQRLPPYMFGRINKLLYQKRRAGSDVIDLGMGNPSDPPTDGGHRQTDGSRPRRQESRLQQIQRNHQSAARSCRQVLEEVWSPPGSRIGSHDLPGFQGGLFPHVPGADGTGRHGHRPRPYFPVHMYAVALAAGNVITLEVADSEKFLDEHRLHLRTSGYPSPSC